VCDVCNDAQQGIAMVPGTSFERSLSKMSPDAGAAGYTGELSAFTDTAYMLGAFEYCLNSWKPAQTTLHAILAAAAQSSTQSKFKHCSDSYRLANSSCLI
jgi:hypothetical protein